jgi:Urate oxidase N-terminal
VHAGQVTISYNLGSLSACLASKVCTFMPVRGHRNTIRALILQVLMGRWPAALIQINVISNEDIKTNAAQIEGGLVCRCRGSAQLPNAASSHHFTRGLCPLYRTQRAMMWESILTEWASLILRWLHVVAAIGWIGSSFYFIHLDLSLKPSGALPDGVHGDAWQVHGGGFYRIMKFLVAPATMPDELTWFKWEAYTT